jgi:hypothetical protein
VSIRSAHTLARDLDRQGYAIVTKETAWGTITGMARRADHGFRVVVDWMDATPCPYPTVAILHDSLTGSPERCALILSTRVQRHAETLSALKRAHLDAYERGSAEN